jgi:hypothetical protein
VISKNRTIPLSRGLRTFTGIGRGPAARPLYDGGTMPGSSPVMLAANRGTAADRRFLHDDEAGALECSTRRLAAIAAHITPASCVRLRPL